MTLIQVDTLTRHGRTNAPPYTRTNDWHADGYDSELEDEEDFQIDPVHGQSAATVGTTSGRKKRWWHYVPLVVMLFFFFVPHPSILLLLISYYLRIHTEPIIFVTNTVVIYALVFCACCSLLVCVVRDPGAVRIETGNTPADILRGDRNTTSTREDADGDESVTEALLAQPTTVRTDSPRAEMSAGWCRKCNAPKPERTHHCSICGRCILKMDHHCPWIAYKCLGHWTYPAFVHFLMCTTFLAAYVFGLSLRIVVAAFQDATNVDEYTAFHAVFLVLYSAIFMLSVGSFWLWHVYLITTGQTTVECLTPFLLLRYLPKASESPQLGGPDSSGNRLTRDENIVTGQGTSTNGVLREHDLTTAQRRHVRIAHNFIRLYDVGWVQNWGQVYGVQNRGWSGWLERFVCGGSTCGDGRCFPRNPRANELLTRLAEELDRLR